MNRNGPTKRLRITLVSVAAVGIVATSLGLIVAAVEPYGRIDGEGVAPLKVSNSFTVAGDRMETIEGPDAG